MTTASSGPITTQTINSGEPSCARTTSGPARGKPTLRATPPPAAAAAPTMNERRLSFSVMTTSSRSSARGGHVNGLTHLLEGAATTDIGNACVDVGVGGFGVFLQIRLTRSDHGASVVA